MYEDAGKTRKRVILFLTDGAPSDSKETKDLFVTIRDRNVELNNSVIILTYGFDKKHEDILIDIANQNGTKYGVPANTSVGDVGVMQTVKSWKNVTNMFKQWCSSLFNLKNKFPFSHVSVEVPR